MLIKESYYQSFIARLIERLTSNLTKIKKVVDDEAHPLTPGFECDLVLKLGSMITDLERLQDVASRIDQIIKGPLEAPEGRSFD